MIRFGVIGTNWITEAFIQAARETEEFDLTAVYSRTEERAKEFADKHGGPRCFTDLEAMAASGELDAVYIASPNSLHARQAFMFLRRGKHVLCEKPIASNARELAGLVQASAESGAALMEALKSTLMPNFEAIREGLAKIGKVRRYFASYGQYSSRYDAYKQGTVLNAFNPAFSNGSLMDLGIYCIYPLAVLFGRPDRIQANGLLLESGVDGEGSLLLHYGEMEGVILHSKISNSHLPSEIQGENGTLVIDKINQPAKVEIRWRDGTVEDLTRPQPNHTMFYEVKEFLELIRSGRTESAVNSHAASMTALAIMDEARRQIGLVFPADTANSGGRGTEP